MNLPRLFGTSRDAEAAEPIRRREIARAFDAGVEHAVLRAKCEDDLFHANAWLGGAGTRVVDRLIVATKSNPTHR